ncbi:MAG: PLP-dependent aminotransferase family protein [Bacillota bacterium]|nr:PLP-dependent aminotransferase family protein [Bacillota bacterium]
MAFKFANRMDNIKASEIREILKLTAQPEIISFAGGLPAVESFPMEAIEAASEKVLKKHTTAALQYSSTDGFLPLREHIVKRMEKVGVKCTAADILVTSGSQQGLEFTAKLFINPGDKIVCESPTYLGALNAFKGYQPEIIECPTDKDGMIIEELDKILAQGGVKFIYAIADFQNPTGNTWSMERRKGLVEMANKHDVVILEDNPYGELRYEGTLMPSIKSLDTQDRVIFLGTFSKILCPGFRLGWIMAGPEILEKFNFIKQGSDLQSCTTTQMQAAQFLDDNDLDEHIQKIIDLYRKRRDVMIDALEKYLPKEVSYTHPEGGLFLWLTFPKGVDSKELAKVAIEKKVAFVPGGAFFPAPGNDNFARLNYSSSDEEKIVEGVKRLSEAIKAFL